MTDRFTLSSEMKVRIARFLAMPIRMLRRVPKADVTGEAAQLAIARAAVSGGHLVARIGSVEAEMIAFYLTKRLGRSAPEPYTEKARHQIRFNAGFFPADDVAMDRLAQIYVRSIAHMDFHAVWTKQDKLLSPRHAIRCRLSDLEPHFTRIRWTLSLNGMRVTIVSPFRDTIESQWKRRDQIFRTPTMPECHLSVVRSPQTHCEADVAGQDWFDNLARMDAEVRKSRPDVVIIGAGAYGLPLGAMAKRQGASAIVLGGATQLLFGIIGNRWLGIPRFAGLMTEAWTRPHEGERPEGYQGLEHTGGAYW